MIKFSFSLVIVFASTVILLGCSTKRSRSKEELAIAAEKADVEERIAIQNARLVSSLKSEAVLFGVNQSSLDSLKLPEITDTASQASVDARIAKAKATQVQLHQAINQILRFKILAIGGSVKNEKAEVPFVYDSTKNQETEYVRALEAESTEADLQQRLQLRFSSAAKAKGTPWPHPVRVGKVLRNIRRFARKLHP
jgi:hypothetical protein